MDASDQATAAILTQKCPSEDGETKEMPIAYLSAQFSDTQFKWSTVVKEGHAIYYAVKKWRHYLEHTEILLTVMLNPFRSFFQVGPTVSNWTDGP